MKSAPSAGLHNKPTLYIHANPRTHPSHDPGPVLLPHAVVVRQAPRAPARLCELEGVLFHVQFMLCRAINRSVGGTLAACGWEFTITSLTYRQRQPFEAEQQAGQRQDARQHFRGLPTRGQVVARGLICVVVVVVVGGGGGGGGYGVAVGVG